MCQQSKCKKSALATPWDQREAIALDHKFMMTLSTGLLVWVPVVGFIPVPWVNELSEDASLSKCKRWEFLTRHQSDKEQSNQPLIPGHPEREHRTPQLSRIKATLLWLACKNHFQLCNVF
jgi:hypothetical protein